MNTKKLISAILMASTLLCFFTFEAKCNTEATEGQYTISADLDATGSWKYRELSPDVSCENLSYFARQDKFGKTTAEERLVELSSDAYSGNYSVKNTVKQAVGLGTKVDYIEYGAKYRVSYVGKVTPVEGKATNPELNLYSALRFTGQKSDESEEEKEIHLGSNIVGATWTPVSAVYTISPANFTSINVEKDMIFWFCTNSSEQYDLWVDDWSIRRMLPDDFFATEVTNAEISDNKAVFTFNLDIDQRTIDADNILLNGQPAADKVKWLNIKTVENTRITTLEIQLCNLKADMDYTLDISSVKDAWGRTVDGEKTLEFSTPVAVDASVEFKSGEKTVTQMVDGSIQAIVSLKNNMDSLTKMFVVAAVCKDNRFVKVVPSSVISLTTEEPVPITLDIDAGTGNDCIRLFFWQESVEGLPLTNYGALSKEGFSKAEY